MGMLEQCPLFLDHEPVHAANRPNTPLSSQYEANISRDRLYQEFAPLVRRLIRRYGTNLNLCQDLIGEIYCCFCNVVKDYDPERGVPLRPYIVRHLSTAVYTYARQQWRLQKRELLRDPMDGRHDPPSVDPTPKWLQAFADQQISAELPEAIARLPERQRQVVTLRFYEERTFEEIADLLNIQSSTARSLLRHGLNNLRKYMRPFLCGQV